MSDNYLNDIRRITQRNPRRFNLIKSKDNKIMDVYVSSSSSSTNANNNDIYKEEINEFPSSDESEIENQEPVTFSTNPTPIFKLLKDDNTGNNSPIRAPKIFDDEDEIMETKDDDFKENIIISPLASKSINIIKSPAYNTDKIVTELKEVKNNEKTFENTENNILDSKEDKTNYHDKLAFNNNSSIDSNTTRFRNNKESMNSKGSPVNIMTPSKLVTTLSKTPSKPFTSQTIYSPKKQFNIFEVVKNLIANFHFVYLFMLIGLIVLFLWTVRFNSTTQNDSNLNSKTTQVYLKKVLYENLEKLKSKYPNQKSSFWANVESTFIHSIINSKDPSIVLIVNDEKTSRLATEITDDLFQSFLNILNKNSNKKEFFIDPIGDTELAKLIFKEKFDLVKSYVDQKLDNIFSNGNKLALLKNIEKLPPTTMLLFYTYGDDLANAKYPGVVIYMSLSLKNIFIEKENKIELLKSPSKLNEFIENYLFNLWSNKIGDDQLRPLFTRIANNVIFVNE